MSYDTNNIFAKILRKELPCIPVFEDENTLAFMDIMPQADGHVLVIPKQQARDIHELDDAAAADLMVKVKLIANAVKQAMQAEGITLFQLNGETAGQTVPHIHFHILPGSILSARAHATVNAEKPHLEAIAEKVRSQLSTG